MSSPDFVQLLTSHQSRLYAYILSLMFDPHQAEDVLQQTNSILWEKESDFELGTNFVAWSFRIAYFQVLAHRKKTHRDRLVFDVELIDSVARIAEKADETFVGRQRILNDCLGKLGDRHRDLIRRKYSVGASLSQIAEDVGKTEGAIKQALFRVRTILSECVAIAMGREVEV